MAKVVILCGGNGMRLCEETEYKPKPSKNILRFMNKLSKQKEIKIDIGCGKNKKEGFIGIDINRKSDADIIASALDLPFENNSVDEIYSSHLVEHFNPKETSKFFAEIYRVLKKGSRAFLKIDQDWTKKRLLKKDITHKHRYSVREIKKILAKLRFSQIRARRRIYSIDLKIRSKIFVELIK